MTERWLAAIADKETSGATDEELDAAATALGIQLPEDYRAVMLRANGGDSAFGDSWIQLWSVEDLADSNADYRVAEFAPGFVVFGSTGGGDAYAWDLRESRRSNYVVMPFIFDPEYATPLGDTFEEFLSILHGGIPFESSGA